MKRSLIIGTSGGIGAAVARSLSGEVITLSRSIDGFEITNETSIESHLSVVRVFGTEGCLV